MLEKNNAGDSKCISDTAEIVETKRDFPKESDKIPPTVHKRAKRLAQAFFRLTVREEQEENKAP